MLSNETCSVVMPFSEHSSAQRINILSWIVCRWMSVFPEGLTPVVVGRDDNVPMNRSKARNSGMGSVRTKYVVLADADTAFDVDAIEVGVELLDAGAPWVIPYGDHEYYNLTQGYTSELLDRSPVDAVEAVEWDHKLLSWAGLAMVRTEDYWKVGGFDEQFVGWGHEDVAFRIKMDAEIGHHVRTPGRALHLWHERSEGFGSPEEKANRRLFNEYVRRYNWKDERLR